MQHYLAGSDEAWDPSPASEPHQDADQEERQRRLHLGTDAKAGECEEECARQKCTKEKQWCINGVQNGKVCDKYEPCHILLLRLNNKF